MPLSIHAFQGIDSGWKADVATGAGSVRVAELLAIPEG